VLSSSFGPSWYPSALAAMSAKSFLSGVLKAWLLA
jgi:hypothetical protein